MHRLIGALLSSELKEQEKLDIIEHEYNIPISQEFREDVRIMCNLSTGIEERATERATEKTSEKFILNMYKKGYTLDQIADVAETGVDEVEAIIKKKEPAMALSFINQKDLKIRRQGVELMGISLSGIGTVGKEQLISSCSNGEPNWSYIPTKGESSKTQAEFVSEIRELARQAATTTNKTESEYISKQVLCLRAEYLSDVAPDRKQLYEQAKNTIKKQTGNPKCKGCGELSLLDFLEKTEGKSSNFAEKKFALAGGGTLNCPILTTGGYGAEIQYQGVTVLSNLGNGWGYEMTPAELAKKDEFYSIYWSEYNLVKESGSSELREMPDYLNQDRPSFEARA